jgi:pimeloyl-ACP methyl ester carboxylesterase
VVVGRHVIYRGAGSSDAAERLLWACYEGSAARTSQNARVDRFRSGTLTFPVRDVPAAGEATGETVVLLHGFPQTSASWDALIPALTAAGYRVLAPDQRGYAPGALAGGRRQYRMSQLVSDVIALVDAADLDRVHVVGHDWGGAVAWAVAAEHPDRLLSMTSLSTPHPSAMLRSMLSSNQLLKSWYMLVFQLPWLPERLLDPKRPAGRKRLVGSLRSSGLSREEAQAAADALAVPGVTTGALNWYRGLPFSGTGVDKVTVPVLYVWSTGDQFLGPRAALLTERYVMGPYTFVEIEGSHWIQAEAAEPLLAHLRAHPAASPS